MKKNKTVIATGLLLVLVLLLFTGISRKLFGRKRPETIPETDTEVSTGIISEPEKDEEDSMPIEPLDSVDKDAPSSSADQSQTGGDNSPGDSEQEVLDSDESSHTEVTETAGGDSSSATEDQEPAENADAPEEPSEESTTEENAPSEEENETSMMTDF